MLIDCCWVKLVVCLDVDEWFKGVVVIFCLLLLLDLLDVFNIILNEVGGVWFVVVGNYLNWCVVIVVCYLLCEIYWNYYQFVNVFGLYFFN